jgi:protein SCO1/2
VSRRLAAALIVAGLTGAPAAAQSLAASAVAPPASAGLPSAIPGLGGPFHLVDHTGTPRSDADYRGRFMLVTFGYTACPDLCPLQLEKIAAALDTLAPAIAAKVAPLFISVDPAHDTPEHLAEYVAGFHPAIIGLTGSLAQVGEVVRAYRVHVAIVSKDGAIDHTGFFYLMGRDGGFLSLITADASAEEIAARIRKYAGP